MKTRKHTIFEIADKKVNKLESRRIKHLVNLIRDKDDRIETAVEKRKERGKRGQFPKFKGKEEK